ncbi:hypothetical protein DXV65_00240 [Pseudomonas fluorescens]|nr:hypothetical protein DXV65_00240 [Pseudomonas fluorescens]
MWELAYLRRRWVSTECINRQPAFASKPAPTGGSGYDSGPRVYEDPMWELACLRRRWVRHARHQLTARLREQARSHRGLRV